jgi:D-alanine-D-alanine ligase
MAHKKIQKHIEIVRSSTVALSSMSQKSCDAIYNLLGLHYEVVGVTVVNNLTDLETLASMRPDLVFMGMKYVPGMLPNSKIWVSDYLDRHGISHTGSGKEAIEFEQNKPLAKQRVLDDGIKTSPFAVIKKGQPFSLADTPLQFPLFVKPTDRGAGVGVDANSVVHDLSELEAKVDSIAADYGADALVEEYLPGREFSVAVLKDVDSNGQIIMPIEIVAGPNKHGDRILSHALKSAALETPVFPVSDGKLRDGLIDLAANAFAALGARDYGRIDIRLDAEGTPHFLEANLIPCLIRGSGNFPKACFINMGMDYDEMILHIVQLGLSRSAIFIDQELAPAVMYSPVNATAPL